MWFCIAAFAQSGVCGTGVTWSLSDGTLTIAGDGAMYDFEKSGNTPSYALYKQQIRHVVFDENVTYVGNNSFYSYPALETVIFNEGLTQIGKQSFYDCDALTSLAFPSTLEQIGVDDTPPNGSSSTFAHCESLREITLPENLSLMGRGIFYGCSGLETVNWNSRDCALTAADTQPYADPQCFTSLTTVNFGSQVHAVPPRIFDGVSSLHKVNTSGSLEFIGEYAFRGTNWLIQKATYGPLYIDKVLYSYEHNPAVIEPLSYTVADGTTCITNFAFKGNKCLVSIEIPASMKYIGNQAFADCTALGEVSWHAVRISDRDRYSASKLFSPSLSNITIAEGVVMLPESFLEGCSGLQSIKLPQSLETIGDKAFSGCKSVKSLVLPDNVKTIGRTAIYDMTALEKLVVGKGVEHFDVYILFGLCNNLKLIEWNALNYEETIFDVYHWQTYRCHAPVEKIVFGADVEYIPGGIFHNVPTLTEVVLGNSAKRIGDGAFRDCPKLENINFPDGLERIECWAFYNCNIKEIFFPASLKYSDTEFGNNLTTVICAMSTPPERLSLRYKEGLSIYVPDSTLYFTAGLGLDSRNLVPMLKASERDYVYTGEAPTAPEYSSNIPGYTLKSVSVPEMAVNAGTYIARVVASFSGPRDFTVDAGAAYNIAKAQDEIIWDQDFSSLHVGDKVELTAHCISGKTVVDYSVSPISISQIVSEDGKYYLDCIHEGEINITASQWTGDENWLNAPSMNRTAVINESSAIENVAGDGVRVSVQDRSITVSGADSVSIWTATGVAVNMSGTGHEFTTEPLESGIYVVVTPQGTRKVKVD